MQKILILIVRFLISLIDCLDIISSAFRMRFSLIIEKCKRRDGNQVTNKKVEEKKVKYAKWFASLFARIFKLDKGFIKFHAKSIGAKMKESKRMQKIQRQNAEKK